MDWCPLAQRDDGGTINSGAFVGGPPRGVLHTTEGGTYAGARATFAGTGYWPHFTVTFETGLFEAYQHLPISVGARALEHNPGTMETNRQSAIQIEIVGHAANAPAFPSAYLDAIKAIMRWIEANAGVTQSCSVRFTAPGLEMRLSDADWLAYDGWCGHQHVPSNVHEDPGAIDIAYLLS